MDYNGTIETAGPNVCLELLDTKRIAKNKDMLLSFPLMPNESKRWKSRAELIDYWLSSVNEHFVSVPFTVTIQANKTIEAEVGKKQ